MPISVSTFANMPSSLVDLLLCGAAQSYTMEFILKPNRHVTIPSLPPVPPRLSLVSGSINELENADWVVLHSIEANVYDDTEIDEESPDPGLVAIRDSQENWKALVQTPLIGVQIYDFQPNFFRPQFYVNGIDILRESSNSTEVEDGLPIPYEKVIMKNLGRVRSGDVIARAHCAQRISLPDGDRYALYRIKLFAHFILVTGAPEPQSPIIPLR